MGVSTDACIAFGVDYGEEAPWVDEEGEERFDSDELVKLLPEYAALGQDPWEAIPDEVFAHGASPDFQTWKQQNPQWEARRNAHVAATEKPETRVPITIETHCSCDYPMYIVAIKGTAHKAWRGDPKTLDLSDMIRSVNSDDLRRAAAFCEEYGICDFEDPKWLLYSLWC